MKQSTFSLIFGASLFFLVFSSFVGFEAQNASLLPNSSILKRVEGGIGIGAFSKVRKQGDEKILIQYIDKNGKRVTAEASTGQTGTKHKDDDLKKGDSREVKAERIKKAINTSPQLQGQVKATRHGFIVIVEALSPNKGIEKFHVTDNANEQKNKSYIELPAETIRKMKGLIPKPSYVGRVIMIGGIEGVDDDDLPASVTIGTARWKKEWPTSEFSDLPGLISTIVKDLVSHGIKARLENPYSIKIDLDPTIDHELIYGNTDVGIHQSAGVGFE